MKDQIADKYKSAINKLENHIENLERFQKQMRASKSVQSKQKLQEKCDREVKNCSSLIEWIDVSLKNWNENGTNPEHENFDIKWSESHVSIFW